MAPPKSGAAPLVLVCGEEEFSVKARARQLFQEWVKASGSMDQEIINGSAANTGEALAALRKLRESLQTLPFFGGEKIIWFQDCSFLGDDRTAASAAVGEFLGELAAELKAFSWTNVKLLISAGKVDKRKTFFKAVEKTGTVEIYAGWSADDKNWPDLAAEIVEKKLGENRKRISPEAVAQLVQYVGPNPRLIQSEVEKLVMYLGKKEEATLDDVDAIVTRNKHARAFAVGEALAERNLTSALKCLDEELWEINRDSQRSEIGLLYGLISKVRTLLLTRELIDRGYLKLVGQYQAFKTQLDRIPPEVLPKDKRFNPTAGHPYVLFLSTQHASKYTVPELVAAMKILLEANQKLILSNSMDERQILQEALFRIIGKDNTPVRV